MKQTKVEIVKLIIYAIVLFVFIWLVPYYFVGSVDDYQKDQLEAVCKDIANKKNVQEYQSINDFMYQNQKHYACLIGSNLKQIYVYNENGMYVTNVYASPYFNLIQELEGKTTIGLYNDEVVVVQKVFNKDDLDIFYYQKDGTKVFDMRGINEDEE